MSPRSNQNQETERRQSQPPEIFAKNPGYLVSKVGEQAQLVFERALVPTGLRAATYAVLKLIAHNGPSSQRDLSAVLGIDRTTMVSVIDELERSHRVMRVQDEADRRRYAVTLTPDGVQTLEMADELAAHTQEQFFAVLDKRQQQQLHDMLARLFQTFSEQP